MTNNISSAGIWVPLRPNEVPSETMKMVKTVVGQIPELPHSAHKIIEMVSNEESVLQELVEQISSDPMLVSNILKEVNSSFFGLKRKIDDIQLAVVLLGFNEVKNIAIRSCITQSLGKGGGLKVLTQKTYGNIPIWFRCAPVHSAVKMIHRAGGFC